MSSSTLIFETEHSNLVDEATNLIATMILTFISSNSIISLI